MNNFEIYIHSNKNNCNSGNVLWYPSSGEDVSPLFLDYSSDYNEPSIVIMNDVKSNLFRNSIFNQHNGVIFKYNNTCWLNYSRHNVIPIHSYTAILEGKQKNNERNFLFINDSNDRVLKLFFRYKISVDWIHSWFCKGSNWHNNIVAFDNIIKLLNVKILSTDEFYLSFTEFVLKRIHPYYLKSVPHLNCKLSDKILDLHIHRF